MFGFPKRDNKTKSQSPLKHFQIWGDVTQLSEADLRAGLKHWQERVGKPNNEHVTAERVARYESEIQRRQSQSPQVNQIEALERQIALLCVEVKSLKTNLESLEKRVNRALADANRTSS